MLPLYTLLEKIDPRLHEAGRDLYCSGYRTWRYVTWPLSLPGVIAGTLLTFIPAVGDYINAYMLGSPNTMVIGQVIENEALRDQSGYPVASAMGVVLTVGTVLLVIFYVQESRNGGPAVISKALNWIRAHVLLAVTILIFAFLVAPNVVMLAFSFNEPANKYNFVWNKFSTNAWQNPCASSDMCASIKLSVIIAVIATIGATALGTMVAFAMVRYRFKARSAINVLLFLPMAAPEVTMGMTLLRSSTTPSACSLGFWTIVIAHVMFSLSYVVVTVKARLAGMDPTLEKAAADLYATPIQTFRRVTLPLVMPGILAAALLSFALSIDDYIITVLTAGDEVTCSRCTSTPRSSTRYRRRSTSSVRRCCSSRWRASRLRPGAADHQDAQGVAVHIV